LIAVPTFSAVDLMPSNRLPDFSVDRHPLRFTFEIAAPRPSAVSQQAFVVCPTALTPVAHPAQLAWQMSIYRLAHERARAVVAARQRAREAAHLWN
jgi:hypothetical protein